MSMHNTEFYEANDGSVGLLCKGCREEIGGIELGEEADSLQVLVDMFNLHECEEGN